VTVNHAAIENGWQLAAGTPPLTIDCRRNSINSNTVRSGAGPVDHAALPVLLEGDLHTMSAQIVERRFCSDQNLAVEHYWRRLQLLDAADDSAPNEVLRDAFYRATTAAEQQRRRRENETVAGLAGMATTVVGKRRGIPAPRARPASSPSSYVADWVAASI
jgi:hypothetical protein